MSGFTRTWEVRFSDTDPFGIAHYPRIVDAVLETSDMLMEDIGYEQRVCANHGGKGAIEIPDDLREAFAEYTDDD